MFNKLKQIQELKSQANQIKKALAEETVEGAGGWGQVKIIMFPINLFGIISSFEISLNHDIRPSGRGD